MTPYNPFRDCPKCQSPVHRNSKVTCKACGGPSPWAVAEETGAPGDAPPPQPPAQPGALPAAGVERAAVHLPGVVSNRDPVGDLPPGNRTEPGTRLEHDFDPPDAEVAKFLANQPGAVAAREEEAQRLADEQLLSGPHVFVDKFSCMVGPVMAHFKPGQLVTDFPLIMVLRAEKAPMVPAATAPGMACCPQCRHVFRPPTALPAARRAG